MLNKQMHKNSNRKYHACRLFKVGAKTSVGCGHLKINSFYGSLLQCTLYNVRVHQYKLSHIDCDPPLKKLAMSALIKK
jgi:hypothetical protein